MRSIASSISCLLVLAAVAACGSSSSTPTPNVDGGGDASTPSWVQRGLDGNIVYSVAVDPKVPTTVFVGLSAGGAEKGFHRTKDEGKTWTKLAGGLPDLASGLIVVHPQLGTVLANPGAAGIYRSTDGGDSWTQSDLTLGSFSALLFHPAQNTAWTLTSQNGAYRSADGGATWVKTPNTGLPLNQFVLGPLAFDGAKLYMATDGNGVYVSTDLGDSWSKVGAGLPDGASGGSMLNIAATTARPGVVFVNTLNAGVFRSDDGAATFTKMGTGTNKPRYGGLRIDPTTPTTLYASIDETAGGVGGLVSSTNDGKAWSTIGPENQAVDAIDVTPDGTLYAGTIGKGVWRRGH